MAAVDVSAADTCYHFSRNCLITSSRLTREVQVYLGGRKLFLPLEPGEQMLPHTPTLLP
jgi:hypothetical protein